MHKWHTDGKLISNGGLQTELAHDVSHQSRIWRQSLASSAASAFTLSADIQTLVSA